MRSMTVRTSDGIVRIFEGDPQLHELFTGTYFVSVPDPTSPSGRSVAWQQRIRMAGPKAWTSPSASSNRRPSSPRP